MKKIVLTACMAAAVTTTALADDFKTAGDGTLWTMTRLAQTESSGVERTDNIFTMYNTVEIAEGDRFAIEDGITIKMADGVKLDIEGEADFEADERVLITTADDFDNPYGIFISNDKSTTTMTNIDFEYAGLRNFGAFGMNIDGCTFTWHNAVSGTSALSMGTNGAAFSITNCTFTECQKSAIGGAANYMNPVTIENCTFTHNGTANTNAPQLNITTAESVVIRNNKVTGNPEHNMVGGIVVSNLLGLTGALNTIIEGNEIRDNRFGIATYCEQTATIKNNTIVNNNHETNPMNGGSGINIYDPYVTQTTTITANYIEGNLWGITVIGGKNVNIGKTEDPSAADYNPGRNIFFNNGFDGITYDLYNNSQNTVYAQGNYWKSVSSQTQENIETVVFHKNDNPSLGEVIFMPALDNDPTAINATINTASHDRAEIFTIGGTRIDTPADNLPAGIYVIKSADGTTHKIIRK